jgi:hypothetical protein
VTARSACVVYVLVAAAMSWPLLPQIASAPAGDMGDPLFIAWVVGWGSELVTAMLAGESGEFTRWWNAYIFHPGTLELGYYEHLAPQILMGLPLWWATGNILLVYNTIYLATSVLSGLGMFLLVRELTGRPRAALVAGLFFAFVPYRVAQLPHLQVLSSQWMPYAKLRTARWRKGSNTKPQSSTSANKVSNPAVPSMCFSQSARHDVFPAWEMTFKQSR